MSLQACWPSPQARSCSLLGPSSRHRTARVLLAVAALGAACTAGGFTCFFALAGAEGPARASFITYVAAVVAGVVVLGEPLTPHAVAGALLILLGAAVAARRPAQKHTASSSIPVPERNGPDAHGASVATTGKSDVSSEAEQS
ncbi:EamA family transporter [Streptomyces sp. NPDC091972]|uniref:EamA family transporter n=1 Tax=Streptomyces sp. NPDC091972 TaxID=3366007 RepID=UPI003801BFC9